MRTECCICIYTNAKSEVLTLCIMRSEVDIEEKAARAKAYRCHRTMIASRRSADRALNVNADTAVRSAFAAPLVRLTEIKCVCLCSLSPAPPRPLHLA